MNLIIFFFLANEPYYALQSNLPLLPLSAVRRPQKLLTFSVGRSAHLGGQVPGSLDQSRLTGFIYRHLLLTGRQLQAALAVDAVFAGGEADRAAVGWARLAAAHLHVALRCGA